MLKLSDLQKQFVSDLFAGTQFLHPLLKTTPKLNAKEQLDIYRGSVVGALQKTLKNIFPVCHKIVGEDFFVEMVQQYIEKNASLSPDIAHYGERFPHFISYFKPAENLMYLSDVAQLEWVWHSIASVPESPSLHFEALTKHLEQNQTAIRFFLPTKSVLFKSAYPILRIWEVNQADFSGDPVVILEENTFFYYLIWRDKINLRMDILSAPEWQVLSWIKEGFTLEKIQEKINEQCSEINLEKILPECVERKFIVDFVV